MTGRTKLTKKRLGELTAQTLRLGHFALSNPTRVEFYCPLNPDGRHSVSHRITLDYWIVKPPKRADYVRRLAEHLDPENDECEYVRAAGNSAVEADERMKRGSW